MKDYLTGAALMLCIFAGTFAVYRAVGEAGILVAAVAAIAGLWLGGVEWFRETIDAWMFRK